MPAITISSRENKTAFTLIELLMGIAILGVLAAITFGVFQGVKDSQNRARAKAELSVLSQALERFKSKYGDYPWTAVGSDPSNLDPADNMTVAKNNSAMLLNALMGWGRFDISGVSPVFDPNLKGDALIDVSKFTVREIDSDLNFVDYPANSSQAPSGYYLSDPMGNPYVYLYGKSASLSGWDNFSYILYSKGSDGVDSVVGLDIATGIAKSDDIYRYNVQNADNLYVGE
jgi:prepilin-type N-terminal cleavage/methylation domain-containing protein